MPSDVVAAGHPFGHKMIQLGQTPCVEGQRPVLGLEAAAESLRLRVVLGATRRAGPALIVLQQEPGSSSPVRAEVRPNARLAQSASRTFGSKPFCPGPRSFLAAHSHLPSCPPVAPYAGSIADTHGPCHPPRTAPTRARGTPSSKAPRSWGGMPYSLAFCLGVFSPARASNTTWDSTFGEYLFLTLASASLRHNPGCSLPHIPTGSTSHHSRVQLPGVMTGPHRRPGHPPGQRHASCLPGLRRRLLLLQRCGRGGAPSPASGPRRAYPNPGSRCSSG